MRKPPPTTNERAQLDKFKELARELEADEDEEHFERTVREIAPKAKKPEDEDGQG